MTKARIATIVAVVVAAAIALILEMSSNSDIASASNASFSSEENTPAPEPAMTTESIPQSRREGFRPPPSDVAGISTPEGKPTR